MPLECRRPFDYSRRRRREKLNAAEQQQVFFYLLLHLLLGLVGGAGLRYLLRPSAAREKLRSWLGYLVCMALIFWIARTIGHFPKNQVSATLSNVGTALYAISFLLLAFTGRRA